MNVGPCFGDCGRIMDRGPHGRCKNCAQVTDGGELSMCSYHEIVYGEPDPDCAHCREGGE